MSIKEEFTNLFEKLKTQRDVINLRLHLSSMEAREEFEKAEKKWEQVKVKVAEIADDTKETSEEVIVKTKMVGEELKDTYHRIKQRLSESDKR